MVDMSFDIFKSKFIDEIMVLLICNDIELDEVKNIVDLPWNCIFTTSNNGELYARLFSSDTRQIRDICRVEDLHCNIFDRRNLKVIRILPDDFENEDANKLLTQRLRSQKMVRMLNVINEMIQYSGYLCIVGYNSDNNLLNEALCNLIAEMRDKCTIFIKPSISPSSELMELSSIKKAYIINDFNSVDNHSIDNNDIISQDDKKFDKVQLYVSGSIAYINKRDLFYVSNFASLLTYEEVCKKNIPKYLYENYFYSFLKNSANSPQWYGFKYGFYVKRNIDEELYRITTRALKNPGKENQKPILIVGQTGSGKTLVTHNLAYTIFTERIFPVIYIGNSMVNFSPYLIGDNHITKTIKSEEFDILDNLLQNLEKANAQSTLIIWDMSAYKRDLDRCLQLDFALKSRGRNFQIVCTSYEIEDFSIMDQFRVIQCGIMLLNSDNQANDEIGSLLSILSEKANMSKFELDSINKFIRNSDNGKNLLALFYQVFYDIRPSLSHGVHQEASKSLNDILKSLSDPKTEAQPLITSMQIAFEKAGAKPFIDQENEQQIDETRIDGSLQNTISEFLLITSVCSKFGLAIPSRLALSSLGGVNIDMIKAVAKIPFFRYEGLENGDFSYKIRSALEANILLNHYHIGKEQEMKLIAKLISHIQGNSSLYYNNEVKLISELLYRIGPNATGSNNSPYFEFYPIITSALRYLREESSVQEPSLVLQEIVLIREYTVLNSARFDIDSYISDLEHAIEIGSEMLMQMENRNSSLSLRNALTVEISNSKLRLCEIRPSCQKDFCSSIKHDMQMLWRSAPDDVYSYDVWFRAGRREYDNSTDGIEKTILLSSMCDVADQLQNVNPTIAYNQFIARHLSYIYSKISSLRAEDYFSALISVGSSAGIHLQVKSILFDADIRLEKARDLSEKEKDIIVVVCQDYLENPDYYSITINDSKCQYLLLQLKWLLYNNESILTKHRQTTRMTQTQWNEIRDIAENFKAKFIDTTQAEPYVSCIILYILALSYAQTKDYLRCSSIVKTVREKSDSIYIRSRLFIKHILCDDKGNPLEYAGAFLNTSEFADKGTVNIFDLSSVFTKGIYYHKSNIRGIPIRDGAVHTDFQLGLGFMGLSVLRGQTGGVTRE